MARASVETERREQILNATCRVISSQGSRSLRVADVAASIGSATGTVHYYFPTKRDLLNAAFEYNFRRSLERRTAILQADGDPMVRLRDLVDSYLPVGDETLQAWRVWAELWVEAIHQTELQGVNDSVYGQWRSIIAGIIRDGHDLGLIKSGDAVVQANLLISAIDGLAIQVILGSRNMTVERMRMACHYYLDDLDLSAHVAGSKARRVHN